MNRIKSIRRKPTIDHATVPYNIINNFGKVTEKTCITADRNNEKIYKSLISKARNAAKNIENTGLSMSLEVPPPPTPNNRDKWILWKKRNVQKYVIPQSEAVLFLNEKGYKLNEHYEAYQAIDLVNEIKKKTGDTEIQTTSIENGNKFNNLYRTEDKNVYRRRSMYGNNAFNNIISQFKDKPVTESDMQEDNSTNNLSLYPNIEEIENSFIPSAPTNNSFPTAPPPSAPPTEIKLQNDCNKNIQQNTLYPSY